MKTLGNVIAVAAGLAVIGGLCYGGYLGGAYLVAQYGALQQPAQNAIGATCLAGLLAAVVVWLIARARAQARLRTQRAGGYAALLSALRNRAANGAPEDDADSDLAAAEQQLLLWGSNRAIRHYLACKSLCTGKDASREFLNALDQFLVTTRNDLGLSTDSVSSRMLGVLFLGNVPRETTREAFSQAESREPAA
jgi:hypothetical protein